MTEKEIKSETNQTTKEEDLKQTDSKSVMVSYVNKISNPPQDGDIVEGVVIASGINSLYVDLPPFGTGIIYGKEYINIRDVIKNINIGDTVSAKVVEAEGKDGYVELSLKEARQAIVWAEAEKAMKAKTILDLPVKEANRGGLMIDWQGLTGFLPVSQLSSEKYPRVDGGDKEKIFEELKKLIGERISVAIITVDPKEHKLIFSERSSDQEAKEEKIGEKYHVGDIIEGEVTGAVDFGIFVKLDDSLEGLVHISEISWSLVENPREVYKPGTKVQVKVIDVDKGKVSLSIKALQESPWENAKDKYKAGIEVEAVVIKFNKHGALASVQEGVAGLVHVSGFESEQDMKSKLSLGTSYKFKINVFDPKDQKMTLTLA